LVFTTCGFMNESPSLRSIPYQTLVHYMYIYEAYTNVGHLCTYTSQRLQLYWILLLWLCTCKNYTYSLITQLNQQLSAC